MSCPSQRFRPAQTKPLTWLQMHGTSSKNVDTHDFFINISAGIKVVKYLQKLTQSNRRQR